MAKKVEGYIKLQIPAGKATPAVSVCHLNHLASCVTCLSYIKRCTTHGYAHQKPDKWYERCRAARQASRQRVFKNRQDESVQDE